ncbi:MAG: pyrroline-5-carboxylate reductase dimerization domain-containing protein [Pyramidobacter porci]|uniref:pyrroline-5-carboxylate reductase family protein n=1 Tax=Pyramidobacter porci TaxID=2605789 RepID=UPI002A7602E6|nr:pyrroline-5-carboxylate reductase dimerization domain-containing protein [Pyramidobacter porci]MCI6259787.1 NAD(P)-binding domain-containing protein [Pyramidobacter sp.]MDY2648369.1 pyrroline-5-carboxylate reductase dimerization domain-containing protein [Pyramidobacter porci]
MNVEELRPIIVGGGNLGGAVARGLFRAGVSPVVVQHRGTNFDALVGDGIETVAALAEAVPLGRGPVFVALKPWLIESYCAENAALLAGRALVSCAALVDLEVLEKSVPSARWGRVMPNIASAVGAGFTGIVRGGWTETEFEEVRGLCELFGDAVEVSEKDLDGVVCLSGSALAYVLELLEGFIQGGLAVGMKSDLSLRAGAATLIGAAELARQKNVHPAALKDAVCTPGGTTIAGLRALQRAGFKSAFVEALAATAEKARGGAAAFEKSRR